MLEIRALFTYHKGVVCSNEYAERTRLMPLNRRDISQLRLTGWKIHSTGVSGKIQGFQTND